MNNNTQQKTVVAALIGAPNAGKSTLLNALVDDDVSIVSPRVQTTRCCVRGIAVQGQTQSIFVDTPGIFLAKGKLHRAMVDAAWSAAQQCDVVLCLIDATKGLDHKAQHVLERAVSLERPIAVLFNKVDLVAKEALLPLAQTVSEAYAVSDIFMLSAKKQDGIEQLTEWLNNRAIKMPWLFPEDQISDIPTMLMAAETTREALFYALEQELPYSVLIETEAWEENDTSVRIHQVIYVKRASHKPIVLGKGGALIKQVGIKARQKISRQLGKRVQLFLHVKLRENWENEDRSYAIMGLAGD